MPPSHEPTDYECPFCEFIAGTITEFNNQNDIVYQDNRTTAFIGPIAARSNIGHVLVVPNEHYENIYSIPDEDLALVDKVVKKVATAMRGTYGCPGISIRQNNETAGDQQHWQMPVQ